MKGAETTIRAARADDVPVLAAMNAQLIVDEGHSNDMALGELQARMENWLHGDYHAYVCEGENSELQGYALYRVEPKFFYLRQLFVARNCRRRGIATALLTYLCDNVCCDKPVRLEVLIENHGALQFYRAFGFKDYCLTLVK